MIFAVVAPCIKKRKTIENASAQKRLLGGVIIWSHFVEETIGTRERRERESGSS
jgi:hypothetical protein